MADHLGFTLLWGWILVSVLFVPTWLGHWWIGVVLFVLGFVVCWQAADASSDPVYTIGTKREVRTDRVESDHVDCDACGRSAAGGEYRRYERRRVLFGTTIAVPESGENVYCSRCVDGPRDSSPNADAASEWDASGSKATDSAADDRTALESERS
ncbi:hypothetical protein CP557_04905 [Natrinema ejinorense]|uniref:DUF8108 domain-containing protein n=1 Tax=Natrinema ejinorense TaxID=373386 RepID=A0A2A5QSW2_9EURY|nr:hypothetical protein CP557_04905 [Natrinema ejinorense]